MALTKNCSKFLFYTKTLGVTFDKTLMLGRLSLYASKVELADVLSFFKIDKNLTDISFKDEYSEPLFELLDASVIDSLDYSDYEKATVIHDLNTPVPQILKGKYSAIVDGGTIEHVFNFPVAIKNCMEMLRIGGHYIGITPVNNTMGHGFYQFSPELYFNIFNGDNGFKVVKAIIYTQNEDESFSDWYEVMDPSTVKSRVMLVNSKPTYLMVLAEKINESVVFQKTPQQSDYKTLWAIRKALQENKAPDNEGSLKYIYRKFMPRPLKIFLRNVYDLFTKEKIRDENLGNINPEYFRKMEIPQNQEKS